VLVEQVVMAVAVWLEMAKILSLGASQLEVVEKAGFITTVLVVTVVLVVVVLDQVELVELKL
jgi:hypothetical protein